DSMIGKLIVRGTSRERAIMRMRGALSEMFMTGIKTNIPLQREIFQDPGFVEGGVSIHHLEKMLEARKK
ncbi:MAG: acetyl-CoA carboxylase biotin carboxylase subunit, partial [Gammaproteobacteria bacterium]|nr:acetyl-CoA carboxylase biotin carboxylase subunit [Gammaproteobacteria bacterium]